MTHDISPDISNRYASRRLMAMGEALLKGVSLTDVARQFGVPLQAMRDVVLSKPRKGRHRKRPLLSEELSAQAELLIRQGRKCRDVAQALNVAPNKLRKALASRGATVSSIKKENLERAFRMYREGVAIARILRETGISTAIFYSYLSDGDRRQRPRWVNLDKEREAKIELAVRLYRDGTRIRDIERETGLTNPTIYKAVRRRGLFEPRRSSGSCASTNHVPLAHDH